MKRWLFVNTHDSVETGRKLVAFYVEEHDLRLPHSAFRGQTPEKMQFGMSANVPGQLEQ